MRKDYSRDTMIYPNHLEPLPPASLLKAARRLLRPLVRLMMRNGITFPILSEALRSLFVEVAVNDILTEPNARTNSRISLLSGIHRKEIKRLREIPPDASDTPDLVTLASQIVARWVGTVRFVDADGRPRPLSRTNPGTEASDFSFDALVGSVTTDIRPRAVLDDLLSHGVVFMDADDRVRLNTEAFIPRPGGEEQLFYFARNLHDHVAAAVANIGAVGIAPFLDRSVHYDGLTPAQANALQAYARAAANRVLLDVNRQALELIQSEPATDQDEPRRVNFGIYVFDDGTPLAVGGEV
ncbi:MAG: hypothetical protein QOG73_1000 [Acetobacteraceae bacterium]|jgi:Family of unknown function (DUF6502)|nr:hypothetical protein [Acetobacteraceae bacterium]